LRPGKTSAIVKLNYYFPEERQDKGGGDETVSMVRFASGSDISGRLPNQTPQIQKIQTSPSRISKASGISAM